MGKNFRDSSGHSSLRMTKRGAQNDRKKKVQNDNKRMSC